MIYDDDNLIWTSAAISMVKQGQKERREEEFDTDIYIWVDGGCYGYCLQCLWIAGQSIIKYVHSLCTALSINIRLGRAFYTGPNLTFNSEYSDLSKLTIEKMVIRMIIVSIVIKRGLITVTIMIMMISVL